VKEAKVYKAVKGDQVDELFAIHLNKARLAINVKRLGPGKYMFGTKQILAKIINGKLVIRVGGGYMSAEEFIEQYGKLELLKMMKAQEAAENMGDDSGSIGSGGRRSTSGGARKSMRTDTTGVHGMGHSGSMSMADMKAQMRGSLLNIKTYEGGGSGSGGTNITKGTTNMADL